MGFDVALMYRGHSEGVLEDALGLSKTRGKVTVTVEDLRDHIRDGGKKLHLRSVQKGFRNRRMGVGGGLLMEPWRLLVHGCERIEDRRQLLVLNVKQCECLFSDVRRLGSHGHDFFPDETHPVAGEDWHIEQEAAEPHLWQVGASQHGVHARQLPGGRDIDGEDTRVWDRTAQTLPPQHTW